MKEEDQVVDIRNLLMEQAQRYIGEERDKPLIVSVMGQTGVGKSSLINALFGTSLKTDPVRPCTKVVERVTVRGSDGSVMWFNDMPGIGESERADQQYLEEYRKKLTDSDAVIWAIHADTRSVTADLATLSRLIRTKQGAEQAARLFNKITFVLTKTDLAAVAPWGYGKADGHGYFAPGPVNRPVLDDKAEYFRQALLDPFRDLMYASTHHEGPFTIKDERFTVGQGLIGYRGSLDQQTLQTLERRHPDYAQVLDRLHAVHQVVPCSARFRFNLAKLLVTVVAKATGTATLRLEKFINISGMHHVTPREMEKMRNIIPLDLK